MKTLPALLSLLIWFSDGLSAQVLLVSPQPTLAPHDCPCVDCKCIKCECDKNAKPVESVKKSYTPTEASVIVRATKGKEIAQCSGTAIDDRTVISCWHVTRGDGWTYTVNGKPATLLRSDSASDVALFTTAETLKPVRVADKPLAAGEPCHAYGFEGQHKGILYRWRTKIAALNRYRGFPNQSIIGRPQSGRSGGGLFNEQGELVGVCSAADGSEGLYAGHAAIMAILAGKTTPFFLQPDSVSPCPDGTCPLLPKQGVSQPQSKPVPPLTVAPRQQAISGPVFSNCPSGICPLVPKQAPPKSLGTAVENPVLLSPGSSRAYYTPTRRGLFIRRN